MPIDLAALVQTAISAVPDGIAAVATFKRTVAGVMTYATDSSVGTTEEQFTARCVALPYKPEPHRGLTLVPDRTRTLLVAASDCVFTPAHDDTVVLADGFTYKVNAPEPLAPAGVNALLTITVSR